MITLNSEQAQECLMDAAKAKVMPMLVGSPGIGKSAIVRGIADKCNLKLIDIRLSQCDPCDLLGFPDIDRKAGKASYVPMDVFPLEGDKIPEGYAGWLLFFDEANSADKAVQKAWYKTVLDKMIGTRNIHSRVVMMSAGNLDTDNAIVEEMSTALESRMVHYQLSISLDSWLKWAMDSEIDHRITSFVQFKPDLLYSFKPNHPDKTYACPRTWEFANRFLQQREVGDPLLRANLAGTLSEGVAREFLGYCEIYTSLPTTQQIIASAKTITVPNEPSILYALTGSIASKITEGTSEALITFVARMPKEFQIVCLREAIKRNEDCMDYQSVKEWISKNSQELW